MSDTATRVLSLEDDLLELLGPAAVSTEPRVRGRPEVRENEEETTAVDSTDAPDILSSDVLPESNDDDGEGNPPAAGAGQPL